MSVSGWLPNLIGPVRISDEGTVVTARGELDFVGFNITDNAAQDRIEIEMPPLSLTITVGAAGSNATYIVDGVADEVQINAAITQCNAAGGGVVELLPGTYYPSADIIMLSKVWLRGSSRGSVIIQIPATWSVVSNTAVIRMAGSDGGSITITSDVAKGDNSIDVTSNATYVAVSERSYLTLVSETLWDPIGST